MSFPGKLDIPESEYRFAEILTDPIEMELCLRHELNRERIKCGDGRILYGINIDGKRYKKDLSQWDKPYLDSLEKREFETVLKKQRDPPLYAKSEYRMPLFNVPMWRLLRDKNTVFFGSFARFSKLVNRILQEEGDWEEYLDENFSSFGINKPGGESNTQIHSFIINWSQSKESLISDFRRFLDKHSPDWEKTHPLYVAPPARGVGNSSYIRKLKNSLNYIARSRIWDFYGENPSKAGAFCGLVGIESPNRKTFIKSKTEVNELVREDIYMEF